MPLDEDSTLALTERLSVHQSDAEFDTTLEHSIDTTLEASLT